MKGKCQSNVFCKRPQECKVCDRCFKVLMKKAAAQVESKALKKGVEEALKKATTQGEGKDSKATLSACHERSHMCKSKVDNLDGIDVVKRLDDSVQVSRGMWLARKDAMVNKMRGPLIQRSLVMMQRSGPDKEMRLCELDLTIGRLAQEQLFDVFFSIDVCTRNAALFSSSSKEEEENVGKDKGEKEEMADEVFLQLLMIGFEKKKKPSL